MPKYSPAWGLLAVATFLITRKAAAGSVAGRELVHKDEGEGTQEPEIPTETYPMRPIDDSWIPPGQGAPLHAMLSGDPKRPEIAAALSEMDDYLASSGINTSWVSAKELTTMPKGSTSSGRKPVAIPPRGLWENIIPTLRLWENEIRGPMGVPMRLRAYRPVDYNTAVGGAAGSQHQWFSALDIYLDGDNNTAKNRRSLGVMGALAYLSAPEHKIGFGAYGSPTPSNIHLDTGFSRRKWKDAQYFIDKAQKVS